MSTSSLRVRRPVSRLIGASLLSIAVGTATAPVVSADPAPATQDQASADGSLTDQRIDELLSAPIPEDFEGLLAHMKNISHAAGATNEEVTQIGIDLKKAKGQVDEANKAVGDSQRRAEDAQRKLEDSRTEVSGVAQAVYRGATIDPVSVVAGASGPQAAIERNSYMVSLEDSNNRQLDGLDKNLLEAVQATSDANRAKFRADFRVNDLNARQKKLDGRSAKLDDLKNKVMDIVDGFSPEDRQRWVDSNGPIDVDVETFLRDLKAPGGGQISADLSGVVAAAMSKLGSPYGWGAAGPDQFDCSGLMFWAYQQMGKTIPRTSQAQLSGGTSVSMDALQPGDIVAYYPGATHVGMYIGNGQVVHASDYGIPVQVVPVDSMPAVGAARY